MIFQKGSLFNQISGNLPQSFSSLSNIQTMNLQNNQFTGDINALANLPLRNLNLENNHFTGWIPDSLRNINIQKGGNSWSSGAAPPPPPGTPPSGKHRHDRGGGNGPSDSSGGKRSRKRRFQKRSLSDAEKPDNQTLAPLTAPGFHEMKSVQPTPIINVKSFDSSDSFNLKPPPVDRHKSFDEEEFVVKPIVVKKAIVPPTNVSLYSVADLQMATGSFSVDNLLGEGSFGRVYRAQFEDGMVFAIKKIDSSALPSDRSDNFLEMVSNVSRINHPNVTELRGYCAEHGQHLLVYELQKIGSLFDFLHLPDEYSKPLTWNSRVKIALGTARALEYLHEVCSPSIVHKNIKSANILLDLELNPHVSDCGLASFLPNAEQILNQDTGLGYRAPEVSMTGQYSLKSDVYSFGVVMLELLTGRKPFDNSRQRSEQSLVRWATPQLHDIDALSRMVDPALKGLYPVKSLSRFADVIALSVQGEPEFRPPMSEVVQALVRLVQRANMSKRTFSGDQRGSQRSDEGDALEKVS
ncbi:hypothetical protein MLD38_005171 [Melastoma candidum]|uniref:Uncharacterized protein n=1 Tax=Melastoma candidum TaxID=119954 RepID=A0ACB9S777_9MYRT|nr:hypothetical protein MLD38_005171 [Melastoma candidum]